MIRVVQWATGGVGKAAAEGVLRRPELELVGCYVHSPEKAGRDVGEIIGTDPIGALVGTNVVVTIAVNWLMGEQNLESGWQFGPDGPRYEVEVKGDPGAFVVIQGWHPATVAEGLSRNPGIVATAVHCVNSVPYVCAAEPGIKSCLEFPIVTGRAHPDLAGSHG